MKLSRGSIFAAAVALVWMLSAVISITLSFTAGAVQLVWLPSAISVAGLYIARKGDRSRLLLALLPANLLLNLWFGMGPLQSLGFTVANFTELLIIVALSRRVIGHRSINSLHLQDMVLLFLGVVAGTLVSAILVYPFRADQHLANVAWWLLSKTLGVTVGVPLLIQAHRWFRDRKTSKSRLHKDRAPAFLISMVAMFGLSWLVLGSSSLPLGPLLLAGLMFAVVRFGQLGASGSVLAFGIAGTIRMHGDGIPGMVGSFDGPVAGIVLQGYMLLMLAASLPLAALFAQHDRLTLRLNVRNARMRESLLMLSMAEEIARIGRWHYDARTGKQDWSRQMFLINGVPPSLGRDPGDMKALLPDGGAELFGQLEHHAKDRARFSFEYRIRTPAGEDRILKMYASNQFADDGELVGTFAVVMDVTEHYQRQEALDNERTRAMRLAAEAQYLAHTDPLTGLANRRRAITQIEKCVRRSEQDGRPTALISFDIDHFKRVNDANGHQIGDNVLVRIADIARSQARANDLIGRLGGEEFVWLLPGAGADEALAAAERLRQAIELESSAGGLPQVTASIGYALWREGDDANQLLGRVDAALYEAKGAGRNKVQKAA